MSTRSTPVTPYPDRDAAVENYEKSFNSFKTVHGEQRVAAIDAALKRLTPEQQQEVSSLVGSHGDPVKNIEAYVQRLGIARSQVPETFACGRSGGQEAAGGRRPRWRKLISALRR